MRTMPFACSALALLALGGCADRCETVDADTPILVDHCPTYTYVKDGSDEAQLLTDEAALRGMDGVANVRTRMSDVSSSIAVTVHRGDSDIAVRKRLLGMGYHRRW